ncbi:MAG: dUTP diphosphatase [Clostridium sp.]|jgi:dUTP pyrophosphatase|nr:dUTP diphosphatase [Clostridium sp.]
MSEIFKVRRLRESAKLPFRATDGSAGMDLYACIDSPVTLGAGEKAVIPTGIAIELPSAELAAFVFARSGLAIKHGIGLLNGVGVIDSDYRGEICVGVINQLAETYTIAPDERIAQLVIMPVSLITPVEAQSLDDTARGEGGFGSTGKA